MNFIKTFLSCGFLFLLSLFSYSQEQESVKSFSGHSDFVNSVSFSPEGKFIVSGSDDKTIKLGDDDKEFLQLSYSKEIKKDMAASPIFAPKGEFETSAEYAERQEKEEPFLDELYEKYETIRISTKNCRAKPNP